MSAAELNEINEEETAIAKATQDSVSLLGQVQALVVTDQQTHDLAVDLYKASLSLEKAVHGAHDPVCDHWHKLWKGACANRQVDLDKVVEAKKLAKDKYDTWELEQERIRQEEERRKQEEALRKQRETEEAERQRLAKLEEEERLRLAANAEELGATAEQVNDILEGPISIPEVEAYVPPEPPPLPTVAPTFKKAAGVSARWAYSVRVTDLIALIKAAAVSPHLAGFLQPNESALNAIARSQKDAFSLPGCTLEKRRV